MMKDYLKPEKLTELASRSVTPSPVSFLYPLSSLVLRHRLSSFDPCASSAVKNNVTVL